MPLTGTYDPGPPSPARDHAEVYENSGGTEGTTMQGLPIVLLASVGARSGNLRRNPLIRIEHDGEYGAIASVGGGPTHPAWYHNLLASPHVMIRDGTQVRDYVAREVHGEERDTWWTRAVAVQPVYDDYQAMTERRIPVFVLSPVND